MPKVSLIIATHSRPQLLLRAVQSAKTAGSDIEIIVVDDASVDETAEICRNLEGIKYIRAERNQYTAGARNIGILASSGEYIAFLDDDDWRLPKSIDKQVEILDRYPECGFVYGQFYSADQKGNILDDPPKPQNNLEGDIFWDLIQFNFIGCLTVLFRKSCLSKVGLLNPTLRGIDDWDLWIRISEMYSVRYLNEPIAVWTKAQSDSGQGSSDLNALLIPSIEIFQQHWSKLPKFKNASKPDREKALNSFEKTLKNILIDDFFATKSLKQSAKKLSYVISKMPSCLLDSYTYKVIFKKLSST